MGSTREARRGYSSLCCFFFLVVVILLVFDVEIVLDGFVNHGSGDLGGRREWFLGVSFCGFIF